MPSDCPGQLIRQIQMPRLAATISVGDIFPRSQGPIRKFDVLHVLLRSCRRLWEDLTVWSLSPPKRQLDRAPPCSTCANGQFSLDEGARSWLLEKQEVRTQASGSEGKMQRLEAYKTAPSLHPTSRVNVLNGSVRRHTITCYHHAAVLNHRRFCRCSPRKLCLQYQLPKPLPQSSQSRRLDSQGQQTKRWLSSRQCVESELHPRRGFWRPISQFRDYLDEMCTDARRCQGQLHCLRLRALIQPGANLQRYRAPFNRPNLYQLQGCIRQWLLQGGGLGHGVHQL